MHNDAVIPLISTTEIHRKYHHEISLSLPVDGMYIFILSAIIDQIRDNLLRIVVIMSSHIFPVRGDIERLRMSGRGVIGVPFNPIYQSVPVGAWRRDGRIFRVPSLRTQAKPVSSNATKNVR